MYCNAMHHISPSHGFFWRPPPPPPPLLLLLSSSSSSSPPPLGFILSSLKANCSRVCFVLFYEHWCSTASSYDLPTPLAQGGKRLLVSLLGRVYDCSAGKEFFGRGGPYEIFAGRDGTYNLAVQWQLSFAQCVMHVILESEIQAKMFCRHGQKMKRERGEFLRRFSSFEKSSTHSIGVKSLCLKRETWISLPI